MATATVKSDIIMTEQTDGRSMQTSETDLALKQFTLQTINITDEEYIMAKTVFHTANPLLHIRNQRLSTQCKGKHDSLQLNKRKHQNQQNTLSYPGYMTSYEVALFYTSRATHHA